MKDFPKRLFPSSIKTGDSVYQKVKIFLVDLDKTKKLRKEIEGLMDDLFVD